MSLFRKPTKKIQRRVFAADDDDDEGQPDAPPPPVISRKKENIPVKSTALLSFADEEDDGEVFQVKKSSQSKRISKKREKERKRTGDGDNNFDIDNLEVKPVAQTNNVDKPKKKKVTLEGLILSGREAMCADGDGDVSDSGGEDEAPGGFHRFRGDSLRAALAASDSIPDAALIHAARKTRQQARELGDFVPLRNVEEEAKPGARLVHDDGSGDDDEERIIVRGLDMPSDKPQRGTAAATSDVEMDSEVEEWEEQQIKKAVPAIVDITGEGELNPFSVVPPPPPRLADAPAHLRPLCASDSPITTVQGLMAALVNRMQELQIDRQKTALKRAELQKRLSEAAQRREQLQARTRPLDAAYRRSQAARGYCTDLIECLDEKMPLLEALESKALALHRRRTALVVERRRADTRDQAEDLMALVGRSGATKAPESEDKIRRVAEREGRRRARRLKREAGGATHHRDGDSSDDELPPADRLALDAQAAEIRHGALALFSDALAAWRTVRGVCARLARLRKRAPDLYRDAYIADCLPALLAPYVRHQLILWNPLADEDNEDFERMDWYKCAMMYGVRSERASSDSSQSSDDEEDQVPERPSAAVDPDDPDLMLVPKLINKVLIPKITELVSNAWDPMCVRACVRLRGVLVKLGNTPRARSSLVKLSAAAHERLADAVQHDLYLPAVPHHVMEGPAGGVWRRGLGSGVRLLRSAVALCAPPDLLMADQHALQIIRTLCLAAGAAPPVNAAAAAAALASTLPRAPAPLPRTALPRIAVLAQRALAGLQGDNPMHLKALEQARAVLAEARTVDESD